MSKPRNPSERENTVSHDSCKIFAIKSRLVPNLMQIYPIEGMIESQHPNIVKYLVELFSKKYSITTFLVEV